MIRIGISGFSYRNWIGRFYPQDLKPKDYFAYYLQHFDTLELNASFYHLPSAQTFAGWYEKTPAGFLFAVKAPRYITHLKKLILPNDLFDPFFLHTAELKEKLGPILFQLPPGWKCDLQRLTDFVEALPSDHWYTFEFRNPDWYNDRVYSLLQEHNMAFCIYDLAGHQSPVEVTAGFVYIRLHGPTSDKYVGSYSDKQLHEWAENLSGWDAEGIDGYIYFDNTDREGYAPYNALTLRSMINA